MLHRERLKPPEYVYPPDEWKLIETRFYPKFLPPMETLFSLANGYLGLRGNFEEGAPAHQNGTFINGFYDTWPIVYGEEAFGFAKMGQTIVNVTDAKIIKLYVDDEPFYLPAANLANFERVLDFQAGTLSREVLWETPSGKLVSIKSKRLVSLEYRHLAAISYEVTILNARAPVVISSEMVTPLVGEDSVSDPRRAHGLKGQVLQPRFNYVNDQRLLLSHMTARSHMALACGSEHVITTESPYTYKTKCSENAAKVLYNVDAEPGVPITVCKYMAYHKSKTHPPEELCERVEWTLDRALEHGFDSLLASQRGYLDKYWQRSDIQLFVDPAKARRPTKEIQHWIRFNLFHLCQATARAENAGIPAKGLTGQGYEGHYFWDAEIYMMPFLMYTEPRLAKNLLEHRYSMLDQARQRAREVNERGALFPWRTINGEEASAYYAAGTAQYHINADIMYALQKYSAVTGDVDFLYRQGAEMLVETARLWRDLGFYSEEKNGKFCINGVTGPDEYNTVVNNNTYTNLMARENLWFAARTIKKLQEQQPGLFIELMDKTGLNVAEIEAWQNAADKMYIPYDDKTGIHLQDDSFLEKEVWDFENTPFDKYPLLLHYHPLVIYRHRVIKQADIMLAMFLLGDEFSLEQKKRNFDYYDPLTTGDSSLSVGIQSILAFEVGYIEKALEYARYSVLMDLYDVGGNVADGCHIASMGATWMILVNGFAGMRDYDGQISFNPQRLEGRLKFSLQVKGQVLEVDIIRDKATYTLKEGKNLTIFHENEEVFLTRETPRAVRDVADKRA
jgi:alpha,alpha-trehalose phosphorylase